jgi:hypothetical protein
MSDVDSVPPVDERSVNPIGFLAEPAVGSAKLMQVGDRWEIRGPGVDPLPVDPSGLVTDVDVARLRSVREVEIEWGRHTGPIAAVRSVASLAAAGIPLRAPAIPGWADSLGSELIDLITGVAEGDLDDNIRREEHSIRLRRAALRTHSTRARWRNLGVTAGLPAPVSSTVSVVLCTKRPDFIRSALAQIARQRHVDLEVVLVLHGLESELPEIRSATSSFVWPLTVVQVQGSSPFGEALNRGAAVAAGQYLAKWDDDDWYGPEFLADGLLAMDYAGADLVGCLHQYIYLEHINLTIRRPGGNSERFTRQISGNSLLMGRNVFGEAGGFPPIPRNVDTGLLRSIESAGGRIYRTHGMASMVNRRESGHTWHQPLTVFLRASTRQWRGFQPGALMEADEIMEVRTSHHGEVAQRV